MSKPAGREWLFSQAESLATHLGRALMSTSAATSSRQWTSRRLINTLRVSQTDRKEKPPQTSTGCGGVGWGGVGGFQDHTGWHPVQGTAFKLLLSMRNVALRFFPHCCQRAFKMSHLFLLLLRGLNVGSTRKPGIPPPRVGGGRNWFHFCYTRSCGAYWIRLGLGLRNASLETKRQVLRKRLGKSGESRQSWPLGDQF